MKLHIGGVSLFLALSGLPLGIANALDTGVQNLSISQQESTCKGVVKDVTILFSALTRMFPKPTFAP